MTVPNNVTAETETDKSTHLYLMQGKLAYKKNIYISVINVLRESSLWILIINHSSSVL